MDAQDSADPIELPLVFKGSASEYFRVWIVNLCLTLFTFGIFSAWAKVRKKRYFYSHTELDGVPFEYLARPIPILKGRLVGVALLSLWYVGTHFAYELMFVALAAGAVVAPWVMVRSAAFNARYSAYRNVTFEFHGRYWGAAGTLLVSALLVMVTCGAGYPWAIARVRRFFLHNTSFGGVPVRYTTTGGQLFVPFLFVGLAGAFVAFTLALGGGAARLAKNPTPVVVVTYAFYGLVFAYLQARLARAHWRGTTLGPVGFQAAYSARSFIWLYFSNAVAIIASLGLLIPWAAVRMYRYRIERFAVHQWASLDDFQGETSATVRAAGAEVADLFDFDLAL